MPRFGVGGGARRRHGLRRTTELQNVVEGQIAEICRDLAVQAKRMRQLQEQADELRAQIRQWAGHSEADSYREPLT
jgi:polyhydroxyalkanoate synthesis regulator phasin